MFYLFLPVIIAFVWSIHRVYKVGHDVQQFTDQGKYTTHQQKERLKIPNNTIAHTVNQLKQIYIAP